MNRYIDKLSTKMCAMQRISTLINNSERLANDSTQESKVAEEIEKDGSTAEYYRSISEQENKRVLLYLEEMQGNIGEVRQLLNLIETEIETIRLQKSETVPSAV